ncbi:MAG TPA: RNA 3'-terminal phosphate cyclase, partial [Phycisphaerales bacterium]|nr:RNA 3'-terminal phosphate cyclase [Phycisphaerales bacterium]
MIHIDGSQGEGGGQILRSSLALSMATGRAFRMSRIRAGRERPGLMRQHLTCVQAAATICSGEVTGATVGSQEITFAPGPVCAGNYHFSIGTAGGTTLVLQAVLPALLRAGGRSRIRVEGGTHNLAAPPFEFFDRALLPLLNRAGAVVRARLERHGFYPAGGGRVVVEIDPAGGPRPLELLARGKR